MEHQQYQKRRVASIRVEPYLAQYARRKFKADPRTGGIIIPDSFDLYHCVWQLMEKRPRGVGDAPDANLTIYLPARRSDGGTLQKNPAHWNYLSPRHVRQVEKALRRLFNWEYHYWMEDNELSPRPVQAKQRMRDFMRRYGIGIDSEDALLKNWQRHKRAMSVFLNLGGGKNRKKRKI